MQPVRWEHTNTTRTLFQGPGLMKGFVVSGRGGAANCQIYDGVDTTGKLMFDIGQLDGSGLTHDFGDGALFSVGVHVVCSGANIRVSIGWLPYGF